MVVYCRILGEMQPTAAFVCGFLPIWICSVHTSILNSIYDKKGLLQKKPRAVFPYKCSQSLPHFYRRSALVYPFPNYPWNGTADETNVLHRQHRLIFYGFPTALLLCHIEDTYQFLPFQNYTYVASGHGLKIGGGISIQICVWWDTQQVRYQVIQNDTTPIALLHTKYVKK